MSVLPGPARLLTILAAALAAGCSDSSDAPNAAQAPLPPAGVCPPETISGWTRLALTGPVVLGFAVSPRGPEVVYASTDHGSPELLRSRDGGRTFCPLPGPRGIVVAGGARPEVVYVLANSGLLRSDDWGDHWSPRGARRNPLGFVVHPTDPDRLATVQFTAEISLSKDGGVTWTEVAGPAGTTRASAVAFDPLNPDRLYLIASDTSDHLFRSDDGGGKWLRLPVELGSALTLVLSTALAVDSAGTLFVASRSSHLWRSSDAGVSWTSTAPLPGRVDFGLAVDPKQAGNVYVTTGEWTMRTVDGGQSWREVPGAAQVLLVGAGGKVYSHDTLSPKALRGSDDGGETWQPRILLPATNGVETQAVMSSSGRLVIARDRSLAITGDAGQTWRLTDVPGKGAVVSLQVHPKEVGVVYLATATDDGGQSIGGESFRSADDGRSLTPWPLRLAPTVPLPPMVTPSMQDGLWILGFSALVIDETTPTRMYALAVGSLARSDDAGASWRWLLVSQPSTVERRNALAAAPSDPAVLYVALGDGALRRTGDGGQSWQELPLPPPAEGVGPRHLAVHPTNPSQIAIVREGSLNNTSYTDALVSADGGRTWTMLPGAPFNLKTIAFDPRPPHHLYLGSKDQLMSTANAGTSWDPLTPPGAYDSRSRGGLSVAFAPTPGTLYAVDSGGTVFRSTTGGK